MATTSKRDPITEPIRTAFAKLVSEATGSDSIDALWLAQLLEASQAVGGRLYSANVAESPDILAALGTLELRPSQASPLPERRRQALRSLLTAKRTQAIVVAGDETVQASGAEPSFVYAPAIVDGQSVAVVELQMALETSPENSRNALQLVCAAVDCYAEFEQRRRRQKQATRLALLDEVEPFVAAVHEKLSVAHATYVVVNDGRKIIGCDRLTILLRRGSRYYVAAASGVDEVEPRSQVAKRLVRLAAPVAAAGEPLYFQGRSEQFAPQIRDALNEYLDESYVRELAVVPLLPPTDPPPDDKPSRRKKQSLPIGVLVPEWIENVSAKVGRQERTEFIARHAGLAVAKAREHEAIPLLPLWRACAGVGKLFAPNVRIKTFAVLTTIVVAIVALCLIPTDFVLHARGTLQPQSRHHVFAPYDGTVKAIHVRHGEQVAAGQLLIELKNTDLDVSISDAVGERTAAAEQLLATELSLFERESRLATKDRQELAGRRSELRQKIAGFDEQLALLQRKRESLRIVSPLAGEVMTWDVDHLLRDRPVRQGQVLVDVAKSSGPWELELHIPEDGISRLLSAQAERTEPLRVSYRLAAEPRTDRAAVLREVEHSAEVRGDEGNTVLAKANLESESLPLLRPGAEATAKVYCGRCSLGYAWLHDAVDFVRMKILFRLY